MGKDGDLQLHDCHAYHKGAMEAASNFIRTYECPSTDVRNLVHEGRLKQAKENRDRLKPIIESIIFLGHQNIALRGHRYDGPISELTQNSSAINEGNLRELLRFRVHAIDMVLKTHLENCASKATYISKNSTK